VDAFRHPLFLLLLLMVTLLHSSISWAGCKDQLLQSQQHLW
jgi:hypothetical protein